VRGGVPTHHAERALLALWVAHAQFCADVLWRAFARFGGRGRLVLACATLMELGGGLLLRPLVALHETFSDRHAELSIGREARLQGARHLLIATEDYGYFAVMASYGWPSRAEVLHDHDPRRPSADAPFSSARWLENELGQRGARWLVAARRHAPLLEGLGRIAAKNERFVLLEVKR
jgi:hypothetical protein